MIPEREIMRLCPPRTLYRAQQIAALDRNILTKQCRYDEFDTKISAFVASSSGWNDRYRASVVIDEIDEEILDYSCTCPASLKYDGLCKHAAALVLSFNETPEKFLGYRSVRRPETAPSIVEFMQRARRMVSDLEPGQVDIEVTLGYGYENWSAQCKIVGPKGSYVMKNISEFVEHLRNGDNVAYGKKLTFTHALPAFTKRGQKVAMFLDRALAQREASHAQAYWRSRLPEVGRKLDLTNAELIELVDILAETPFTLEGLDPGIRTINHVRVVDADPMIDLRIDKVDGGYVIARDKDIVFAAEGTRMLVLEGSTVHRCSAEFALCADFLESVYRSSDERLFISEADMPLFCSTVIPTIEKQLHISAPAAMERYRPVACRFEFYFDRVERAVSLEARVLYGEQYYLLGVEGARGEQDAPVEGPLRDEKREERAMMLIREYFMRDLTIGIQDDDALTRLLFGGLARFQQLGAVFTTPAFDRLTTDRKPRITLGISLAGDLINLDVSSDDLPLEDLAGVLASYRKRKRFHRLKDGAFLDLEDYDLAEFDKLANDLGISVTEFASGRVELPTYQAFYLDRELGDARRDASFERYVRSFQSIDQDAYEIPVDLHGELRAYQAEGFRWLSALIDMGFGGILADEMGLGKSIQLISLLLARREEARAVGPTLIVCPASLVYNWLAEFERFAPDLKVRPIVGPKRDRARIRRDSTCDVLVTSYDLLRMDADDYEGRTYWCHVLDEAQYIKNHATLTTRAVKRVQAKHHLALTGTPMENRLSELWSIFDFLMPGLLGSYMRFRERFELDIIGGDEEAARRLQGLVEPFVLRRLKREVLTDLPDKSETLICVPIKGEQRRLYAAHEQQLRIDLAQQKDKKYAESKVEVLAELTKLRQLCCDPALLYENYRGGSAKVEAVMDLVDQVMDGKQKMLIFSQFTSFLARISQQLEKQGISHYIITGATPKRKRLDLVNAFNVDDTPVFLVSLKAGGTGLNLTGATVVAHADPWWNAAAQNQATDRAHRIGQTKVVNVYRVIAKGTIEERIVRLQEAKSDLADQIIGASGAVSLASLTREDLIGLLQD